MITVATRAICPGRSGSRNQVGSSRREVLGWFPLKELVGLDDLGLWRSW